MNTNALFIIAGALTLAGCGAATAEAEAEADTPLSQLDINSAKRQCVNVAVLQQVPQDAATGICDCTITSLIDAGDFTSSKRPDDAQQQSALDTCIDEYAAEETPAAS